jgi:hypothetical protein
MVGECHRDQGCWVEHDELRLFSAKRNWDGASGCESLGEIGMGAPWTISPDPDRTSASPVC